IIGAGEMSELTAQHLVDNGINKVLVTNRTAERAEELAKCFSGEAVPFDDLPECLAEADIVISSTAAQGYIISQEMMSQVISKRRGRPIFLIDIAVPRDIDPKANKLERVFLYDIDDLEGVVKANVAEREKEARKVHTIIHSEVEAFTKWLHSLEVTPTIAALRQRADAIRDAEIDKVMGKLNGLSDRERNLIQALAGGIINKLLHTPIVKVKEATAQKDGYLYLESLRHLFDLEEADEVGLRRKKKKKKQ
ncbi:MAG: glutamyl-tRNA reductase, partial [Terriglobia bacterium]